MVLKIPGLIYSCRKSYVANLQKWEFVSLIGKQRVEIFPLKSKFLSSLRISSIWYRKIQDWPFLLGGVRWLKYAECWPVRRKDGIIIRIRIKKFFRAVCFRSNFSETVRDIQVSVFTVAKDKNHATKWCKRRLCRFYRFRDIIVVRNRNFECWPVWPSELVYSPEQWFERIIIIIGKMNKEITCSGLCASGRISPKR